MINGQYLLGLRALAEATGIGEKAVRFRVDDERNMLVIEVNDPEMLPVQDGRCAPIVGQVQIARYEVVQFQDDSDYDPDHLVWEFVVETEPKKSSGVA